MSCAKCKDSGWICEIHIDKPFEHKVFFSEGHFNRECFGAGMPCKCNIYNPPWHYPDKTRKEMEK